MRIIAGYLGGRVFDDSPSNKPHPMSERVRGGLFNALGDISNLTILDAFAGTGALSFEALSRGAANALAVEIDKRGHKIISQNTKKLSLQHRVKVVRANVSGWSDNNQQNQFDLVLCDPPYDKLQLSIIQKLVKHVTNGGLLVLSWPGKLIAPELVGLNKIKDLNYSDSQLVFYRKTG